MYTCPSDVSGWRERRHALSTNCTTPCTAHHCTKSLILYQQILNTKVSSFFLFLNNTVYKCPILYLHAAVLWTDTVPLYGDLTASAWRVTSLNCPSFMSWEHAFWPGNMRYKGSNNSRGQSISQTSPHLLIRLPRRVKIFLPPSPWAGLQPGNIISSYLHPAFDKYPCSSVDVFDFSWNFDQSVPLILCLVTEHWYKSLLESGIIFCVGFFFFKKQALVFLKNCTNTKEREKGRQHDNHGSYTVTIALIATRGQHCKTNGNSNTKQNGSENPSLL